MINGSISLGSAMNWDRLLVDLYLISDVSIALSSFAVAAFSRNIYAEMDVPFKRASRSLSQSMYLLGFCRIVSIFNVFFPIYSLYVCVKLITALSMFLTAFLLWAYFPEFKKVMQGHFCLRHDCDNRIQLDG